MSELRPLVEGLLRVGEADVSNFPEADPAEMVTRFIHDPLTPKTHFVAPTNKKQLLYTARAVEKRKHTQIQKHWRR